MKQTFDVTGMTCAACSARVEKAARGVAGVRGVAVNLLKNSMEVEFDDGFDDAAAVSAAVGKAGYGAHLREKGSRPVSGGARKGPDHPAAQEERAVLRRLLVSVAFTVPLFYLSMGHMLGWPLPAALKADEAIGMLALAQLILLVPVLAVNLKFFRTGFKSLARRAPNMDSLIALGSGASTAYGVYALFQIQYHLGLGHLDRAVMAGMDLYFESAAMILTLITLGKYFEARAKLRTTDALSSLMELAPKTGERLCADGSTECVPVE
ncbi:MAG: heavy metal translocating P-type ATPase, partial [Berryella intestinalis]|nr:heavy metal translocating P-type ATPase [Berryella intestinalis]